MDLDKIENEFLGSISKLFREVYELGEVDFSDLWNYIDDYKNPSKGSVPGLIYYDDTEPFARYNFDEIDEALNEIGHTKRISLNDMTWATWELMVSELENFKENYIEQYQDCICEEY